LFLLASAVIGRIGFAQPGCPISASNFDQNDGQAYGRTLDSAVKSSIVAGFILNKEEIASCFDSDAEGIRDSR
jgi:hypothetical protein